MDSCRQSGQLVPTAARADVGVDVSVPLIHFWSAPAAVARVPQSRRNSLPNNRRILFHFFPLHFKRNRWSSHYAASRSPDLDACSGSSLRNPTTPHFAVRQRKILLARLRISLRIDEMRDSFSDCPPRRRNRMAKEKQTRIFVQFFSMRNLLTKSRLLFDPVVNSLLIYRGVGSVEAQSFRPD